MSKEKRVTGREGWSILGHRIKLGCLIVSGATPFEPFPTLELELATKRKRRTRHRHLEAVQESHHVVTSYDQLSIIHSLIRLAGNTRNNPRPIRSQLIE